MMNAEQIKSLLERSIAELKNIDDIPQGTPISELPAEIEARRKAAKFLETILYLSIADERSIDNKDKLFYLPEHDKT